MNGVVKFPVNLIAMKQQTQAGTVNQYFVFEELTHKEMQNSES